MTWRISTWLIANPTFKVTLFALALSATYGLIDIGKRIRQWLSDRSREQSMDAIAQRPVRDNGGLIDVRELGLEISKRGLVTCVRVYNPSAKVAARNVTLLLDGIVATEHPERVRSACPPMIDLPRGKAWVGLFIFSRMHPEMVILRWTNPTGRQLERSIKL